MTQKLRIIGLVVVGSVVIGLVAWAATTCGSVARAPEEGAAAGVTATASQPRTGPIGRVQSIDGQKLIVIDGEGPHEAYMASSVTITRAVGSPSITGLFEVVSGPDVPIRVGDVVALSGVKGRGEVDTVTVNWFIGRGGLIQAVGPDYVDLRQTKRQAELAFEDTPTRVWVAPQATIEKLDANGRYVPASMNDLSLGQYVFFQGLVANDGSMVVMNLGIGKAP